MRVGTRPYADAGGAPCDGLKATMYLAREREQSGALRLRLTRSDIRCLGVDYEVRPLGSVPDAVDVICDGSSIEHRHAAGAGAVFKFGDGDEVMSVPMTYLDPLDAEIAAARLALEALAGIGIPVRCHLDNKQIADTMCGLGRMKRERLAAWQGLVKAAEGVGAPVMWRWRRGHDADPDQVRAHRAADAAARGGDAPAGRSVMREEIASLLGAKAYRALACGERPAEEVAGGWMAGGFSTAAEVGAWLAAGVFTSQAAGELRRAGLTPRDAGVTPVAGDTASLGERYALGEIDLAAAVRLAKRFVDRSRTKH